eukprot:79080_1
MAEKLKVFVRVRPKRDDQQDNFEYNVTLRQFTLKNKIYTIDGILDASTQQRDVYHTVATDPIQAFIQGFNTTIFAYGQTGSGKTHTIFGPDISHQTVLYSPTKSLNSDEPQTPQLRSLFGLVPRSFITVFEKLENANHIKKYQMGLSCVEVYNTTLRDLLVPLNSNNLKIREDIKSKKFFVENLTEETIQTSGELMLFLKRIQVNRAVSSTNMNHASSRSHVLLQLHVLQQLLTGETKESLLTFVDLAGSEMARKTGAEGERLKEAGYINSSLSTLSRVIEGLGIQHSGKKKTSHQHIPFRDSSLTKLLKVALGGNCKTTLVVCVSGEQNHKEETYSSLRFATRAACIKNAPVINKALDAQALYEENQRLKCEIERLGNIHSENNNKWFETKLDELEAKEQDIVELKVNIDDLELQLSKLDHHRGYVERLEEFEEEKMQLTQTINELEIELMRERHSKKNYESKLMDIQMIYSEVTSQETLDHDSTTKVILDAIKFRRSMKSEDIDLNRINPERELTPMNGTEVCEGDINVIMEPRKCNVETQTMQFGLNVEKQTDIDCIEVAPLVDTRCSIFEMFKCRS